MECKAYFQNELAGIQKWYMNFTQNIALISLYMKGEQRVYPTKQYIKVYYIESYWVGHIGSHSNLKMFNLDYKSGWAW